jgi:hypothetical protein
LTYLAEPFLAQYAFDKVRERDASDLSFATYLHHVGVEDALCLHHPWEFAQYFGDLHQSLPKDQPLLNPLHAECLQ